MFAIAMLALSGCNQRYQPASWTPAPRWSANQRAASNANRNRLPAAGYWTTLPGRGTTLPMRGGMTLPMRGGVTLPMRNGTPFLERNVSSGDWSTLPSRDNGALPLRSETTLPE